MVALFAAGAWGCAASPAAAPSAAEPAMTRELREPATIEEAQAQLERARAELPGAHSVGPPTPTTPTQSGAGAAAESTTRADVSGSTQKAAESRCGNACGAMSSMRRAVDAICRMAGDADARCTDARKTLKDSEAKVAGCGCPAP